MEPNVEPAGFSTSFTKVDFTDSSLSALAKLFRKSKYGALYDSAFR